MLSWEREPETTNKRKLCLQCGEPVPKHKHYLCPDCNVARCEVCGKKLSQRYYKRCMDHRRTNTRFYVQDPTGDEYVRKLEAEVKAKRKEAREEGYPA